MSWARRAKEVLAQGKSVQVRPRGNSMTGRINDGDLVTIEPCDPASVKVGDAVLATVKGNDYLHLVKAINDGRFLIGNNRGGVNGWTRRIHGRVARVES